ncbi:MAG TPA: hypothetical protein VKN74_03500 [Candidatus Mcinerneyibacterium sp.]|nr:hypothetical protein [Candidatus Mcinerneyibacterium sp.]
MTVSDFRLTSLVRRLVVQMNFNSNLLNISVINGVAYLKGEIEKNDPTIRKLKKKYKFSDKVLDKKLAQEYKAGLKMLDRNIVRAPGIRGVVYQLKNWEKKAGTGWIRKSTRGST